MEWQRKACVVVLRHAQRKMHMMPHMLRHFSRIVSGVGVCLLVCTELLVQFWSIDIWTSWFTPGAFPDGVAIQRIPMIASHIELHRADFSFVTFFQRPAFEEGRLHLTFLP